MSRKRPFLKQIQLKLLVMSAKDNCPKNTRL
jgi:hypothetical protein